MKNVSPGVCFTFAGYLLAPFHIVFFEKKIVMLFYLKLDFKARFNEESVILW